MSEKFPRPESAPEADPYKAFEALVEAGQWSPRAEETLRALIESHETDMGMIYLMYKESGLVDELPEYELRLYNWLTGKFEEAAE